MTEQCPSFLRWITEMFVHALKPKWFVAMTTQPMKPSVHLMRNQLDEDRQLHSFRNSQCAIGDPAKKVHLNFRAKNSKL